MTNLYISFDGGKSAIKVIYQIDSGEPQYFLLPPNILELSKTEVTQCLEKHKSLSNKSENRAWIEVNDRCFIFGFLASKFYIHDSIKNKKYESAIYKILCSIGIIVDKHDLWKRKIKLSIITALPNKEFIDKTLLSSKVEALIKDFQFGGRKMSLSLKRFICCREGQGLVLIVASQKKPEWLETKKFACLNIGHYNFSGLYYDNSEPIAIDSPALGFGNLIDEIITQTSNLNRETLTSAICSVLNNPKIQIYHQPSKKIVHPNWEKQASIRFLATATDSTLFEAEIKQIADAVNSATTKFWSNRIVPWLDEILPNNLNEVFITGGAARFFEPELEDYFNCHSLWKEEGYKNWVKTGEYSTERGRNRLFTQINWNAGIEDKIQEIFNFSKTINQEQSLTNRFVDCFGLFNYLLSVVASEQASANQKSKLCTNNL